MPDVVWEEYQNAIKQIKMEKETDKNIVKVSKWKNVNALAKIAVVFGAVVLLSGGTFLSVKAYISHLEKIRNMEAEEVIDLYENIFQYDSKYMSRSMSADEERRFSELYDLYCRDMAEPEGEVSLIFYCRSIRRKFQQASPVRCCAVPICRSRSGARLLSGKVLAVCAVRTVIQFY